jgi:hypothetical protein
MTAAKRWTKLAIVNHRPAGQRRHVRKVVESGQSAFERKSRKAAVPSRWASSAATAEFPVDPG